MFTFSSRNENGLRRRRKITTKIAGEVTKNIIFFYLIPATIAVLFLSFLLLDMFEITENATSWFIVSFFLLISSWVSLTILLKSGLHVLTKLERRHSDTIDNINSIIDSKLTPNILTFHDLSSVRLEAAKLFDAVLTEPKEDQFVYYIGAAALTPSSKEEDEILELEENPEEHPSLRFKNSFENLLLPTNDAVVRRYIRFFEDAEFLRRSEKFRQNHLDWLATEIERVQSSESYILMRSERSPVWGTSRSTIITRNAVLDIIGEGEGAILIKGADVAKVVSDKTLLYLNAAKEKRNMPAAFTRNTVNQLKNIHAKLQVVHTSGRAQK